MFLPAVDSVVVVFIKLNTSSFNILPSFPDPGTTDKSIWFSLERRRTAGVANTFPDSVLVKLVVVGVVVGEETTGTAIVVVSTALVVAMVERTVVSGVFVDGGGVKA